ncbi:hypothetical protein [Clostridium luticellarii]|uniref:Uncharacterized protein n=1 Tax=Clostridium luticellarii TaxID=1691940 RepID=A0A2T0BLW0_9CLOT|nr:hypothetical protein [Clostridium luticellarii]PRR84867.1 hypothetical protein CLLU_21320 [Clostridium luticellarii]
MKLNKSYVNRICKNEIIILVILGVMYMEGKLSHQRTSVLRF